MRILVTGGSGYLGSHIRRYFDADDLSRRSDLDILNVQDAQMASDYDVVIHLAACLDKSPSSAPEVFLTNVEGTLNLLRSMREGAMFIYASTKDVYGRFADKYREVPEDCPTLYSGQAALEWSKLIAERYVEFFAHQSRFRSCIFRMSTVYAPASEGNKPNFVGHYADSINKGEPISLLGNGLPRRDILHVDDLSSACDAFISSVIQHGLYNLGGGRRNSMTLEALCKAMEQSSGLQAVVNNNADIPDPIPFNYISDISRITQELDWAPKINIAEGLKTLFR